MILHWYPFLLFWDRDPGLCNFVCEHDYRWQSPVQVRTGFLIISFSPQTQSSRNGRVPQRETWEWLLTANWRSFAEPKERLFSFGVVLFLNIFFLSIPPLGHRFVILRLRIKQMSAFNQRALAKSDRWTVFPGSGVKCLNESNSLPLPPSHWFPCHGRKMIGLPVRLWLAVCVWKPF